MPERIDTKAVLAAPLWLPEDTPTGIVYRCGYCSTIQPSSIYARERHTDLCPRPALAQEIADHAADRQRLEQWEAEAQDKARPQVRPMTVLENAYMDLEGKLGQANAHNEALDIVARAWQAYFDADAAPPRNPYDPDPAVAAFTELQAALAALAAKEKP